jgi:uncharacterized protein YeaO (DUF488 family)
VHRPTFVLKRVYEPPSPTDGCRVLVDRLWPRGLSKEKARIDVWLKEVAPSHDLRRRVHADPDFWDGFVEAYGEELGREPARGAVERLRKLAADGPVTLLFAARDEARNNAVALKAFLDR